MLPIVFINCREYPFVYAIKCGLKLYETRTRNTLKSLIGKRVLIAETGHGKPVVKCLATIDSVIRVDRYRDWIKYRKSCCIKPGSVFDWKHGTKCKCLYLLTDVQPVPEFTPPESVRHGRTWMEYTGEISAPNLEPEYMQYIADCYHCSECWGEKLTVEDMRTNLIEWNKDTDPGDYCPDPSLAEECANYWNQLCDLFPC